MSLRARAAVAALVASATLTTVAAPTHAASNAPAFDAAGTWTRCEIEPTASCTHDGTASVDGALHLTYSLDDTAVSVTPVRNHIISAADLTKVIKIPAISAAVGHELRTLRVELLVEHAHVEMRSLGTSTDGTTSTGFSLDATVVDRATGWSEGQSSKRIMSGSDYVGVAVDVDEGTVTMQTDGDLRDETVVLEVPVFLGGGPARELEARLTVYGFAYTDGTVSAGVIHAAGELSARVVTVELVDRW